MLQRVLKKQLMHMFECQILKLKAALRESFMLFFPQENALTSNNVRLANPEIDFLQFE